MTLDLGGLGYRERLLALGRCPILCWHSSRLVQGHGRPSMVAFVVAFLFLSGLVHMVLAEPHLPRPWPLSVLWDYSRAYIRPIVGAPCTTPCARWQEAFSFQNVVSQSKKSRSLPFSGPHPSPESCHCCPSAPLRVEPSPVSAVILSSLTSI